MNRVKSINLVFLITVIISILGGFINDWISRYTDNYIIMLLISQALLIIPSVIYISMNKLNVLKEIRFNKVKLSNVVLIIIFAFSIMPLMSFINAVSMLFVKNEISNVAFSIVTKNGFWLTLFMMAIVPCILEESVYRGLIYHTYSKVSPLKGILLSGLLFGLMHQNFNQFFYAFAMGVIFALLIEATDSILSSMVVHFIINASSVTMIAILPKMLKMIESLYGSEQYNAQELIDSLETGVEGQLTITMILQSFGIITVVGTILAFIVYRNIAKNANRWEMVRGLFKRRTPEQTTNSIAAETLGNKKGLLSLSLIIGILICVVIMILAEYNSRLPVQPMEGFTTIISLWKFS